MPPKTNLDLLISRHRKMVDFQEKIKPFTPTIGDLLCVWGVNSKNTVFVILRKMEAMGLVKTRKAGDGKKYYAINA